jgi:hypothetical protein
VAVHFTTKLFMLSVAAVCANAAMAGESYVSFGLPGLTVGYAHAVNEYMGLRADVSTTGSFNKNGTESGINYNGKVKYNRLGLFADAFPFSGGFRLSAGVTFAQAQLDLKSHFDGSTPVTINGVTVTPSANDYFNAKVKFPNVMPYLGIGWGHQEREPGLGLVADLGVSIGKAKFTSETNLVGRYGLTQADVDAKTQDIKDSVDKLRVLPQASIGLSYRY